MRTTKPLLRTSLLSLIVIGTFGCDAFSDVVVPAVDTDPPNAITGIYRGGSYLALTTSLSNAPAASYEAASLDDYYIAVGAGIDFGGLKRMTMQPEFNRFCRQGNIGQWQSGLLTPIVRTQSGSTGSTVSDGLWDGPILRLRDYATCSPGYTLDRVEYTWTVTVEDFAGNTSSHGWAKLYWEN